MVITLIRVWDKTLPQPNQNSYSNSTQLRPSFLYLYTLYYPYLARTRAKLLSPFEAIIPKYENESGCARKIRNSGCSSAQRGRETYSQGQWSTGKSLCVIHKQI
jgi:hypothetical protein